MSKASLETEFDAQNSRMTENTPLLAGPSSKAPYERTRSPTTGTCKDSRNIPAQNRTAHSKGKLCIHQQSSSSVLSDSSDKENDFEGSSHRRRTSPGFASPNWQRNTSASPSITLEGGDQYFENATSPRGNTSNEHEAPQSTPASSSAWLYEGFLPSSISLRLENSGSVARDHLASERTFLAYMRTSLAIAASGVALVQLFSAASSTTPNKSTHRLHLYIQPLGASTIFIGLIVLFIGVARYFTIQSSLIKGYFPVARLATGFIAVILTALVTMTFGILLAGKLTPRV